MAQLFDADPEPSEQPRPGYEWAKNEFGWFQVRAPKSKSTPHGNLKRAVIIAIRKLATEQCRPIIVPQFSGRVMVGEGRAQRSYKAGQSGVSDLLVIWHGQAFGFELKAGHDTQRHSQEHWQRLFEKAGGIYALVRRPTEAVDLMTQWAAQRGKGPFG